jgi:phosphoribosyl-AMP cyclohydrolase/2-polyprenyl-6-methoxyphenol hydroxylase-like FAD-dependent oxidoreductase
VREDRKLDRIYLPGEDRDRFGVEEADFDRPAATPELRALVAHEVRRARGLFASAESAVEAAPASVRPGIRLACTIYLGVLDRVEALGYDVLGRRPRLPGLAAPARRAGGAAAMTRRATLRGDERTPLDERADVLICGASFAGLAVARELAGSGADVLVIDRYEIGERQTSACAIPTPWLEPMGIRRAARQELECMSFHTPHGSAPSPAAVELDVVRLPDAVRGAVGAVRRPLRGRQGRAARGRHGHHRPRPAARPADRRRARLAPCARPRRQRPAAGGAHLARPRGTPGGRRRRPRRLDRPLADPARLRMVGARRTASSASASAPTSRATTSRSRRERSPPASACRPVRYQGNWFPHQLRPAVEDGVFFVGDSAGHCFPLSGEGIRTAFYFGIACGRELRAVLAGERTRDAASRPTAAFSRRHARAFAWALALQRAIPALPPRLLARLLALVGRRRVSERAYGGTSARPIRPSPHAPRIRCPMDAIAYDDRGLVPCVVQDWSTGEVLTLAYMNADALERTQATARCHFWSRSRNELWHKGETSGNTQAVKELRYDCDADAILALVEPAGPACHTGERTCFHNGELDPAPHEALPTLERTVEARKADRRRAPTPPSCSPTPP